MSNGGRDIYGRDTISSCETYSNPYDYRPHADFQRARQNLTQPIISGSDKLESEQAKFERQLIEKFQNNQFSMFRTENLGGVIQGGKFMLIAVVMPAYLFLFGLPRWIFQNSVPPLINLLVNAAEKVQGMSRFLSSWAHQMYEAVANKIEQMVAWNKSSQEATQEPPGPIFTALNYAKTRIQDKYTQTKQQINDIFSQVARMLSGAYHFFADPVQNFLQMQLNLMNKIAQGLKHAGEKVADKVEHHLHKVKEHVNHAFELAQGIWNPIAEGASKLYRDLRDNVQKKVDAVKNGAHAIKEWSEKVAHKIIDPVNHSIKHHAEKLWEGVQNTSQIVAAPFVAAATWGQEQMINLAVLSRNFASSASEMGKKSFLWLFTKALPALAAKIMPKWMNPLTWMRQGKRFGNAFKRGAIKLQAFVTAKMASSVYATLGFINRFFLSLKKVILWVLVKLKNRLTALYHKYIQPIRACFTRRNMVLTLRFTWACLKFLGRYIGRKSKELLE